jgi:hypothetical protein
LIQQEHEALDEWVALVMLLAVVVGMVDLDVMVPLVAGEAYRVLRVCFPAQDLELEHVRVS